MDKRLKFNEPWILQRADPYVYEKDGWYYFTASVPAYDSIVLRRAKKLADLPQAEEVVIWKKIENAVRKSLEKAKKDDVILAFGSLSFLGEIVKALDTIRSEV